MCLVLFSGLSAWKIKTTKETLMLMRSFLFELSKLKYEMSKLRELNGKKSKDSKDGGIDFVLLLKPKHGSAFFCSVSQF